MVDEKLPENYGNFLSNRMYDTLSYLYDTRPVRYARYYGSQIYEKVVNSRLIIKSKELKDLTKEVGKEELLNLKSYYDNFVGIAPIQTSKNYYGTLCESFGLDKEWFSKASNNVFRESSDFVYSFHFFPSSVKRQRPEKPSFSEVLTDNWFSEGKCILNYTLSDYFSDNFGKFIAGPAFTAAFYTASLLYYPKLIFLPLLTNTASFIFETCKIVKKRTNKGL